MKCPQCVSDLNFKDVLPLPRLGGMEVAVCAFCGCFVTAAGEDRPPRMLDACASCGAPLSGADENGPLECETCRSGSSRSHPGPRDAEEARGRVGREALEVFGPLPSSEATRYFQHVLEILAAAACDDRSSFRLAPVSELGFGTASVPGGTILAGRELLAALEDEAMLAFVLAREMGHQQSGRTYRRYRSRRASRALAAGLEWGLGLLTRGTFSPGKGEVDTLTEIARLGYGPAHEPQADEWAIKLMAATGYDPAAAVRYLIMMEKRHLAARGVLASFLDVHPVRSRRRCLAETLLAIHRERARPRRLNREVYRRAVSMLAEDDLPRRNARREEPAVPRLGR